MQVAVAQVRTLHVAILELFAVVLAAAALEELRQYSIGPDGEPFHNAENQKEDPTGAKKAQAIGFALTEGKLTGSSFSAACELAEVLDSAGEVAAHGVSGATVEVSGDAVEIDTAVAVTFDTGYTEVQKPGADKSNTAYGTTSFSGARFLAKD